MNEYIIGVIYIKISIIYTIAYNDKWELNGSWFPKDSTSIQIRMLTYIETEPADGRVVRHC